MKSKIPLSAEDPTRESSIRPKFGAKRGRSDDTKLRKLFFELKKISRGGGKSRIGRGFRGGAGAVRFSNRTRRQRVIVKATFVKHGGKISGAKKLRSHVSYLARDGTGLDGKEPQFIGIGGKLARDEVHSETKTWSADRHHFRLYISPERGRELELDWFVEAIISKMERDLETKLSWFGVCHYNTEHPHAHLLIRGKRQDGKDLIIKRDYISHGIRETAIELATDVLGLRKERDVRGALLKDIRAKRLTEIDRFIKREITTLQDGRQIFAFVRGEKNAFYRKLKLERLRYLTSLGLANRLSFRRWELNPQFERRLKELAIEGDRVKSHHEKIRGKERG